MFSCVTREGRSLRSLSCMMSWYPLNYLIHSRPNESLISYLLYTSPIWQWISISENSVHSKTVKPNAFTLGISHFTNHLNVYRLLLSLTKVSVSAMYVRKFLQFLRNCRINWNLLSVWSSCFIKNTAAQIFKRQSYT